MQTSPSNTPTSAMRHSQIQPDSSRPASAGAGRPKAGTRYQDPPGYGHPYDSMRHCARLLHEHFQCGDNGFGNRHLISGARLRRGAGPGGRVSANRVRRPKSCGARSSPKPAASTFRWRSMKAAGSGLLQILQLFAERRRSSKPSQHRNQLPDLIHA